MYKLEYLPAALRDMVEIVRYVNTVLQNPAAASRLSETFIQAVESIPAFPYANPVHVPLRPLKHEYRKLLVHGNYLVPLYTSIASRQIAGKWSVIPMLCDEIEDYFWGFLL